MLLELIAFSVLLASAASVPVSTSALESEELKYTSTIILGSVPDKLQPGPKFQIPSGQCSARINQSLLCGDILPLALSVSVRDPENGYPKIIVADELNYVDIYLKHSELWTCATVNVDLKLVCEGAVPPPLRAQIAVPVALPIVPGHQ